MHSKGLKRQVPTSTISAPQSRFGVRSFTLQVWVEERLYSSDQLARVEHQPMTSLAVPIPPTIISVLIAAEDWAHLEYCNQQLALFVKVAREGD